MKLSKMYVNLMQVGLVVDEQLVREHWYMLLIRVLLPFGLQRGRGRRPVRGPRAGPGTNGDCARDRGFWRGASALGAGMRHGRAEIR